MTDRVIVRCTSVDVLKRLAAKHSSTSSSWTSVLNKWNASGIVPTFDPPPRNAALAAELGMDRFATIFVPAGTDVNAFAAELSAMSDLFDHVELDPSGDATGTVVNDPLFAQQWHLRNTGQVIDGTAGSLGADIEAVGAWEIVTPLSPVTIAIIDTGVSQSHPDFAGVMVPGRNFTSVDPNATDDNANVSHGTYCAGIAGSRWNNATGGSGVGPNIRIMPVKTLATIQFGAQSTCANGLTWAVDNGAQICSMSISWGSSTENGPMATAVAYLSNSNVLLFGSVGNTPGNAIGFPARWEKVIAVGGSSQTDAGWAGATTGVELDIVAPADNILTTCDDNLGGLNGYSYQSGTSMSTPMAAGVAALIWGINPAMSAQQVRNILLGTSDDLGAPGVDPVFGYGRVNAMRGVLAAIATLPCSPDFDRDGVLSVEDIFDFLNHWFAQFPTTDIDRNGLIDPTDIFTFLSAWFNGC
ncbi:MAG: S8 family serine peptidase [Phycisphaerales bacterium]|nr:S8 family serine peptidase [Phycisphaerales bacterium]